MNGYTLLFGYDFFISYARNDAAVYALALANALSEKGYTCFIDQWGSDPGKNLPTSIQKIVRNSKVFILLGSAASLQSNAIAKEIQAFLPTRRPVIAINFGAIR